MPRRAHDLNDQVVGQLWKSHCDSLELQGLARPLDHDPEAPQSASPDDLAAKVSSHGPLPRVLSDPGPANAEAGVSKWDVDVGTKMEHRSRGRGVVVEVLPNDEGGTSYRVEFDNGEVHRYRAESFAAKSNFSGVTRDIAIATTRLVMEEFGLESQTRLSDWTAGIKTQLRELLTVRMPFIQSLCSSRMYFICTYAASMLHSRYQQ